jgi:NAD(P)-dependent dehydrogenase (short-subunit alcohol dehydrogenase family)
MEELMQHDVFRPDLLVGRTAFLAGATSGINFAIAKRFVQLGARTYVVSRKPEKVKSAVDELGAQAAGSAADVRDYEAIAAAVLECSTNWGPIDIVVSGAAGNFLARACDLSPKGFRTIVEIDLIGSFHVLKAAYPHLRRPGAAVLNISALQSFQPVTAQVHACAAKAGIDSMMRCLALEWGSEGIRVNSIAPGPIADTEGMARLTPTAESAEALRRTIPLGRYGEKSDIADLAVFLCSPAGRNITGALVVSDGGQSIGSRAFTLGDGQRGITP